MTEAEQVDQAAAAEALRQVGAEIRKVSEQIHDVSAHAEQVITGAGSAGIAPVNILSLMGLNDDRPALRLARSIVRRAREARRLKVGARA
jgi:hypothetical protein